MIPDKIAIVETVTGQLAWAEVIDEQLLKLENLKSKLKSAREQIKQVLEDDHDYYNATQAAKEVASQKRLAKLNAMQANKSLFEKVEEIQTEIKECKESLDVHTIALWQETGSTKYMSASGIEYEVQLKTKLVKL